GDADHEQVTQALVEDDLGGRARIRAAQDDGERLLARRELGAAVLGDEGVDAPDIGDEALVSLLQTSQGHERWMGAHGRLIAAPVAPDEPIVRAPNANGPWFLGENLGRVRCQHETRERARRTATRRLDGRGPATPDATRGRKGAIQVAARPRDAANTPQRGGVSFAAALRRCPTSRERARSANPRVPA